MSQTRDQKRFSISAADWHHLLISYYSFPVLLRVGGWVDLVCFIAVHVNRCCKIKTFPRICSATFRSDKQQMESAATVSSFSANPLSVLLLFHPQSPEDSTAVSNAYLRWMKEDMFLISANVCALRALPVYYAAVIISRITGLVRPSVPLSVRLYVLYGLLTGEWKSREKNSRWRFSGQMQTACQFSVQRHPESDTYLA